MLAQELQDARNVQTDRVSFRFAFGGWFIRLHDRLPERSRRVQQVIIWLDTFRVYHTHDWTPVYGTTVRVQLTLDSNQDYPYTKTTDRSVGRIPMAKVSRDEIITAAVQLF